MLEDQFLRLFPLYGPMNQTFYALRRLQKALAYEVVCGNVRALSSYADVLAIAEQALPAADWKATHKLALEHVQEFRWNEIPDSTLATWLPSSILPKDIGVLTQI